MHLLHPMFISKILRIILNKGKSSQIREDTDEKSKEKKETQDSRLNKEPRKKGLLENQS